MTVRTKRTRSGKGLCCYKLAELMTGRIDHYGVQNYTGYADSRIAQMPKREHVPRPYVDAKEFICDEMKEDWARYRSEILEFWISGEWTSGLEFRLTPRSEPIRMYPWIWVRGEAGTRPWAWWQFDATEHKTDDESQWEYLNQLGVAFPGETLDNKSSHNTSGE